jgi:hypothetical protein
METVIVLLVVLVAVALVMVPLVRTPRGAGAGDLDPLPPEKRVSREEDSRSAAESSGSRHTAVAAVASSADREEEASPREPEVETSPDEAVPREREVETSPRKRAGRKRVTDPPGERDAEELPQEAPPPGPGRPLGEGPVGAGASPAEAEVLRYREALRARTICPACSSANPPGSKYCKECGERLLPAAG